MRIWLVEHCFAKPPTHMFFTKDSVLPYLHNPVGQVGLARLVSLSHLVASSFQGFPLKHPLSPFCLCFSFQTAPAPCFPQLIPMKIVHGGFTPESAET